MGYAGDTVGVEREGGEGKQVADGGIIRLILRLGPLLIIVDPILLKLECYFVRSIAIRVTCTIQESESDSESAKSFTQTNRTRGL